MSMGEIRVISPLLGTVIAVHATVGSAVAAGKDLIVIESMKMENELCAPHDTFIKKLLITKGNVVQQNQILITFGEKERRHGKEPEKEHGRENINFIWKHFYALRF
mgnify:CR=1 FL=1